MRRGFLFFVHVPFLLSFTSPDACLQADALEDLSLFLCL